MNSFITMPFNSDEYFSGNGFTYSVKIFIANPKRFDPWNGYYLLTKKYCERAHLINDTAQSPQVWWKAVRAVLADFRWQVIRCTDKGFGRSVIQDFWNTEIADLQCLVACEENVGWLQVSVQHVLAVQCLHSEQELDEPIDHYLFVEKVALFLPVFQKGLQIAIFYKLKQYVRNTP